ncbi:MAG: serine/threonine protein kinase [Candidatus Schekmanbacteria bacterium]|nr:serine/threonine protein kinase [Candidatus Schekmanbacteria bacterium]
MSRTVTSRNPVDNPEIPIRNDVSGDKAGAADAGASDGALLGGRYRVVRKIGEGNSASVYLCRDETHDRLVAVKRLRRELLTDANPVTGVLREWRAQVRLRHAKLTTVLGAFVDDAGAPCLVMQHLTEGTLAALLRARGPLAMSDALSLAGQIADGLDYLHGEDLVHGNLNPANVFVSENLRAKLSELAPRGRGRATGQSAGQAPARQSPYLAPEQLQGQPASAAGDAYALGMILLQMVTGEPPPTGRVPGSDVRITDSAEPHLDPRRLGATVTAALRPLLDELTAADPAQRVRSLATVSRAIKELQKIATTPPEGAAGAAAAPQKRGEGTGGEAARRGAIAVGQKPSATSARRLPRFALGVSAVLAAGAALWFALAPPGPPPGRGLAEPGAATTPLPAATAIESWEGVGFAEEPKAIPGIRLAVDLAALFDVARLQKNAAHYAEQIKDPWICTPRQGLTYGLSIAPGSATISPEMTLFATFQDTGPASAATLASFAALIPLVPIDGGIAEPDPSEVLRRAHDIGCRCLVAFNFDEYALDMAVVGEDGLGVAARLSGMARVWDAEKRELVAEAPAGHAATITLHPRRDEQVRLTAELESFLHDRLMVPAMTRAAEELRPFRARFAKRW